MKPPWFFCCGWWSPWCVLDEYPHRWFSAQDEDGCVDRFPWPFGWFCTMHDRAVTRHYSKQEAGRG